MSYPTSVRIIKMTCTGKTDPIFLLRALEEGADAVFVAGCEIGDCHFQKGNVRGKAQVAAAKERLAEIGLETDRLEFFHVAASQPKDWVDAVTEMTERAKRLGPTPFRPDVGKKSS
jgi:coenzyme F420-reducing hydrogenase delta subunit